MCEVMQQLERIEEGENAKCYTAAAFHLQMFYRQAALEAERMQKFHRFTASMKRQTVVPNLDGDGFVVCGASTSQMSTREMADLIEVITAFGFERGVVWSDING